MKVIGPAAVLLVYVALVALHAPLAWTVVALLVLPLALVVVVTRVRGRVPARPTIEPYDPARHGRSAHASALLADARAALEREGFVTLGELALPDRSRRFVSRVLLLENASRAEGALVQAGVTPAGLLRKELCGVELWTTFTDGTRRVTTNVPRLVPLPPFRGIERESLTTVRDVARLCRAHRALVARDPGAVPMREALDGTPAEQLALRLARGLEAQREAGTVRPDRSGATFGFTWRGALRAVSYGLLPVRQLRAGAARRREAALLATLGVGDRDERPFAVPATASFPWGTFALWGALAVVIVLLLPPVPISGTALRVRSRDWPAAAEADVPTPTGLADATRILEALTQSRSRPFVRTDSTGHAAIRPGRVVDAPARVAELILEKVRDPFTARGFQVIRYEHGFGRAPDQLLLLPTSDPYEAVRAVGTDGANYGITTDSVVSWLKGLEREQPFVLAGAGSDFVEGHFLGPVRDPAALARRFNAFCPDIVTQGTETVAVLAREMAATQSFFCWWD